MGLTTASAPVPEPAIIFLMATGLAGVFGIGKKKFIKNV
jgi:hypothetical protein